MSEQLKQYYEKYYAKDVEIKDLPIIKYAKYPKDRYECCIKYFVDNKIGGDFIEFGAGNGLITKSLLNCGLDIKRYVATDLSAPRLESIKNNIDSDILQTFVLDAEKADELNIGQFDAVIFLALIEHLIDPLAAMIKIRNLLKPNGIVFIITPNIADYGARMKLLRGKFPSTGSKNEGLTSYEGKPVEMYDQGHLHYFSYRSLTIMLKKYCGYSVVEKYYHPIGKFYFGKKFHFFLSKIKPELFSNLVVVAKK